MPQVEAKQEDFSDFQNPSAASVDRLVQALDRAYHRPGLLAWRGFVSGLFYALGATVGFTLVITIVLFVLQSLGGVSLFQPAVEKIQTFIADTQNGAKEEQRRSLEELLEEYGATASPITR